MSPLLGSSYNAEILLYSDLDARHARTDHWARQWGAEFRPNLEFKQVLLCKVPDDPGVHLLCLNAEGAVQFSSTFETIEQAKADAESEYSGLSATWASA